MRCPSCNKFASLELQDPEVNDLEVTHVEGNEFQITGSVHFVRASACCGDEMKEATLEMDETITVEAMPKDVKPEDVEIEESGCNVEEGGGGRYAKNMFSATLTYDLKAGGKVIHTGDWSDSIAASHMDEMV